MQDQTFPTIRYHPTMASRLVESAEELAELEEMDDYVWRDTPYPAPESAPNATPFPSPRVNPEVYRLVLRSARGDATTDEQALTHTVVVYLMHVGLGEATPDEEFQVVRLLDEFGMPLWASHAI